MNRRSYRDVVLAQLRVSPFSNSDVFDTEVKGSYNDRPRRYIVLFTFNEPADADRLTGPAVDHDVRFITRSVGRTPNEAMFAADHVMAQLLNQRLVMSGRNSRPLRHVSGDPIRHDKDVGDGLYFYDDEWSWFTTPGRKS